MLFLLVILFYIIFISLLILLRSQTSFISGYGLDFIGAIPISTTWYYYCVCFYIILMYYIILVYM